MSAYSYSPNNVDFLELVAVPILKEYVEDPATNAVIAERVHLPEKTFEKRLTDINRALGVSSLQEAVIEALDQGLVKVPEPTPDDILGVSLLSGAELAVVLAHARGLNRYQVARELGKTERATNRCMDRVSRKLGHVKLPRPQLRNVLKVRSCLRFVEEE